MLVECIRSGLITRITRITAEAGLPTVCMVRRRVSCKHILLLYTCYSL